MQMTSSQKIEKIRNLKDSLLCSVLINQPKECLSKQFCAECPFFNKVHEDAPNHPICDIEQLARFMMYLNSKEVIAILQQRQQGEHYL